MSKNVVMGVVAALALGGAIFMMANRNDGAKGDDPAEGLDQRQVWVCRGCNSDVRMTKNQWMDAVRAGNFRCGSCGGVDLANALDCPHCGGGVITIGHGRLPSTCPRCRQKIGDWADSQEPVGPDLLTPAGPR